MIYCFLADGFEEVEALTPVDLLRRVNIDVKTVGVGTSYPTGSHGIQVKADLIDEKLDFSAMDGIILPGGMPGTLNLEASDTVQNALQYCADNHLWIAAICAAPSVLGHKRLLVGKNATCFPGFEKDLIGASVKNSSVVTDGKIITGKGAGVALDFACELIAQLISREKSEEIRQSIQSN